MTPEEVSVRIAAAFETGISPWSRSSRLRLPCRLPEDASTERPIRGVNTWLLEFAAIERRYRNRFWESGRRWEELGGVVVRGAGTPVLAEDGTQRVLYNLEQVEVRRGSPVAALDRFWVAPAAVPDYVLAQRLLDSTGARVVPDERCHCVVFWDDGSDFIGMLPLDFFLGDRNAYWSVLFHELVHWVVLGRRRLCWDGEYSQGELIAELGAAILTSLCAIPMTGELDVKGEHVQNWIRGIRADLAYFTDACSIAERAVEYVVLSELRQVLHERVQEPVPRRDGGESSVSPFTRSLTTAAPTSRRDSGPTGKIIPGPRTSPRRPGGLTRTP